MVSLLSRACRACVTMNVTLLALAMLMGLALVSCSGVYDPLAPPTSQEEVSDGMDLTRFSESDSNRMLWGYYRMHLNEDHTEIEVEPIRTASVHLNALSLLESKGPANLAITDMFVHDDLTITVAIQLTHPFAMFPEYTGFDVRGIVMMPQEYYWPMHDLITPGVYPGEFSLLNWDGFTRRWNPSEFSEADSPFNYFDGMLIPDGTGELVDSQVNPYKDFYTDSNRHMFQPGYQQIQHYHMSFPPGPTVFGYAIDASWSEHVVNDLHVSEFTSDEKALWKSKDASLAGGIASSDYWSYGWNGSVGVWDEDSLSYGTNGEIHILFSPKFTVPANPSEYHMTLDHELSFDEDNSKNDDLAGIFITPELDIDALVQVFPTGHGYETTDEIAGLEWWYKDFAGTVPDTFDLTDPVNILGADKFHFAFVFVTMNGDDGSNEGGWILKKMVLRDDNAPPTNIPDDFPIAANSKEPYNIELASTEGELQCSIEVWAGGSTQLSVAVSDWNEGAKFGNQKVALEGPMLFDGLLHPTGGAGTTSEYSYIFNVPNNIALTPGEYPVFFSIQVNDPDPTYIPANPNLPLSAYDMFMLEVVEVIPPFCLDNPAIHSVYGGTWQLTGSYPAQHYDAAFLPEIVGGQGGLFFDGGIDSGTQHMMVASIDGDGGDVGTNSLVELSGTEAGTALVCEANMLNGHLLIVSSSDRDNLKVYEADGTFLKEYDLGDNAEDSISEPVCLTTNPDNGDIWLVAHKGNEGIFLERWAFNMMGSDFEYYRDPDATVDLTDYLGTANPEPLAIGINTYYQTLYLFHSRYFGSVECFDMSELPPVHRPEWSQSSIFEESISTTSISGLRKVVGADMVIDHVDGELDAQCRMLVFANSESGGSTLVKIDAFGHNLSSVPLGTQFSCMALNNLPDVADRPLILFPVVGGTEYVVFLPPVGW